MAGYSDMSDGELLAALEKANRRLPLEPAIASRFNARRALETVRIPILNEAFRRDLIGYPPRKKWRAAK
jgi:hypothetical protein